jgi:pyruvate/2-oxoglutarate/acetoin dehydrogenase E1 component
MLEFWEKRVIDTQLQSLVLQELLWVQRSGCRPIVEYMTFNFCLVGIDQIINNAAKMRQMTEDNSMCLSLWSNSFGRTIRATASIRKLVCKHTRS